MSEEQKEYEAMQLVNLMDKMQRQVMYLHFDSRVLILSHIPGSDISSEAGRGRQTRGCGARAAADRGQRPVGEAGQ